MAGSTSPSPAADSRGKRVVLSDIAREAGVSKATVSLALRRDRRIAKATRARICAIAKRLHYVPDPALAALSAYTSGMKTRRPEYSTIVLLTTSKKFKFSECHPTTQLLYDGIERAAQAMGYTLDSLDIGKTAEGQKRASRVLYNRGIRGVILCATSCKRGEIALDWQHFCAVAVMPDGTSSLCHAVHHNHFAGMEEAVRRVKARGYRKPGLIVSREISGRIEHRWTAALNQFAYFEDRRTPPQVFFEDIQGYEFLREWVTKNKIDVVLHGGGAITGAIERMGYRVPRDLGVVSLDLDPGERRCAGIRQERELIAATTVQLLNSQIVANQFCPISSPCTTLVQGIWQEGETLLSDPDRRAAVNPSGP